MFSNFIAISFGYVLSAYRRHGSAISIKPLAPRVLGLRPYKRPIGLTHPYLSAQESSTSCAGG